MNKSSYPRWKALVRAYERWNKPKVCLPDLVRGVSRRATLIGAIASIAITGPAQAILFSGASATGPAPGTLTTLTLKTKSGSNLAANQPFEFGLPIAAATMAPTEQITLSDASSNVLTVQEDNRVIDADGYVRFIKITSVLPSPPAAASTTISIGKAVGTPTTSNPITLSNLLAQTISADTFEFQADLTMPDGTAYRAKATDGLNASATWTYGSAYFEGYWQQGPFCTVFLVLVPFKAVSGGAAHPYLYREMHIAAYKASPGAWNNSTNPITGVKIYRFDENGFNGTSTGWSGTPQDYVYDVVDKVGATNLTPVLSLTGAAGAGTLTLGTTSGYSAAARSTGTFGVSTSAANSSDVGKALYQISTGAMGYIAALLSSTSVGLNVPADKAFGSTSIAAADWKKMGVYHYWGSRVSNTNPAIGGAWWGTNSDVVYPILTTAYLQASGMVPNFVCTTANAVTPDLTQCNTDGAHPCGMDMTSGRIKNYSIDEGATGGADHIGVFTLQQTVAAIYWSDATYHATARAVLMYNAEVGHRLPYWVRNEDYGNINELDDSGLYQFGGAADLQIVMTSYYQGTTWFHAASNHTGQTNYFAYIVTGDLYHLQNQRVLSTRFCTGTSSYCIFNTNLTAMTIAGALITGPGSLPTQTGESVGIGSATNSFPSPLTSQTNRFFYRQITGNTGNLYDTKAHALAGGATGKVTFSTNGANCYFFNGYNRIAFPPKGDGSQTREIAWTARSIGMPLCVYPTSPITPGIIGPDVTQANQKRQVDSMFVYYNTNFTTNVSYIAGGPRFFDVHNGTNGGTFQINYVRQALLQLSEAKVQATNDNIEKLLDWSLADAMQWHVRTDIWPPMFCSSYYVCVLNDLNVSAVPAGSYTYTGISDIAVAVPFGGGLAAFQRIFASNITATVASIADPANVTVTFSGNWFDTAVKTPYEGKAWVIINDGLGHTGCGQIKTINSATQVVIDCTVTTWYNATTGNATPAVGSGQTCTMPVPPPSVANTNVAVADRQYFGSFGTGTNTLNYGVLDRSSLEIAKQRGIDAANYNGAVAEMTGRSFPTTYGAGTGGDAVQYALKSRI